MRSTGTSLRRCAALLAGCTLATACETAKQMGTAVGEGAIQGFYDRVYDESPYGGDSPSTVSGGDSGWGNAWSPSGRGVGVAPRSAAAAPQRDCGGATDELAMYSGDSLRAVQTQVETHNGALTRAKFAELAAGGARLSGARADGVIGIVETSDANSAKFVVLWPSGADPKLVTIEVLNRSGAVIRSADSIALQPRIAIDLDSPNAGGEFDLIYGPAPNSGELTLAASTGAGLSFPTRSLCK